MTNPDIRAALEAAALATIPNSADAGDPPSRTEQRNAAATVAAFLNAPPPSADTIRLHLGEVSPQGMRDIYAYHRWLAAAIERETTP